MENALTMRLVTVLATGLVLLATSPYVHRRQEIFHCRAPEGGAASVLQPVLAVWATKVFSARVKVDNSHHWELITTDP